MQINRQALVDRLNKIRTTKGTGYAPEVDAALDAARTGRLYFVDTASAGEDSFVVADSERAALTEVATAYDDEAACSLDAADWATARGWRATAWEIAA